MSIPVFVMAAGKGTRLAPFTDVLPKPAIPVANEPVLGHLLRLLARQGFRRVVCNIAYRAQDMLDIFGDGRPWGVELNWSQEPEPLGTAGGLRYAQQALQADGADQPVLVLSGDGLHDADLAGLVRAHRESGALVTIALTRVGDSSEYGVVVLDASGRITEFQEKPAPGTEKSNLANTGIYVLDPTVFDLLPPAGGFYDFGNDVFPAILAADGHLHGVELPGYWNDIGGLDALRDSNFAVLDGSVAGDVLEGRGAEDGILVHPTASVAPDATLIAPVVIGANAVIGAGAHVARSVVLPGAEVPPGALLAGATFGSPDGLTAWARSLAEMGALAR